MTEELKHRKIKWLAKNLEGSLWQSRDLKPSFLSTLWVLLLLSIIIVMQTEYKIDARCNHWDWIVCVPTLLWNMAMKWIKVCVFMLHSDCIHLYFISLFSPPCPTRNITLCSSAQVENVMATADVLDLLALFQGEMLHQLTVREWGELNFTMSALKEITQVKM